MSETIVQTVTPKKIRVKKEPVKKVETGTVTSDSPVLNKEEQKNDVTTPEITVYSEQILPDN